MTSLPPSTSPTLALLRPTPEEEVATWVLNGQIWRGPLPMETYVRREQYLADQPFTRNEGITFWVLVDTTQPPNARAILASCETLRKRALVAKGDGKVEEVVSHGIASVFCNPRYRGKGYAGRMVQELARKLDTWQQSNEKMADFTILYSDIGKKFYAREGWECFTSNHITLSCKDAGQVPGVQELRAKDLADLCRRDEEMLKKSMAKQTNEPAKIRVALIPDVETMQWHHSREEFVAKELLGRSPDVKGAYTQTAGGSRVWCIWSRVYGNESDGNTLFILRLAIEGETPPASTSLEARGDHTCAVASDDERVAAIAFLFQAAQLEAGKWEMKDVQVWNPTPLAILAAQKIEPSAHVVPRDEDSIPSLRWHADVGDQMKVEWIYNEKYGWC